MNRQPLISTNTLDGVSPTFEIATQITVHAQGLENTDEVEFWLVQLTEPVRDPCACPPGQVVVPTVLDEVLLLCCGERVTLTRQRPFVVLDAPQGVLMRAKLTGPSGDPFVGPISTQRVYYTETATKNVNDRLRGCPCDSPEIA